MNENEIGSIILDCAIKFHKTLGLGVLVPSMKQSFQNNLKGQG